MELANPNNEQYFQMGKAAFEKGIRCAPVNDPEYMEGYKDRWQGAQIGDEKSKDASECAKAWIDGWNLQNIAHV